MKNKILTNYNSDIVEKEIQRYWEQNKVFDLDFEKKNNFSIILPPPNITGKLHIGHSWDSFIQDVIARYKRMQGFNVLFLPSMDHAGIATEMKVELELNKKNITKKELGKSKFIEEILKWKEEYSQIIRKQWKRMGLSLNYDKEIFTLDEKIKKVVTKCFVQLYNKGLIYKGEKVINYDTKLKTPISNIEVINKEVEGIEYYIQYKFTTSNEYITIMTTRPETIFGDVAIAVNPKDLTKKKYIGKKVLIPIIDKEIPIISDESIDLTKGTGFVKITPNHDINDYEVAKRNNLLGLMNNIIEKDATLSFVKEVPIEYRGKDRFEVRKLIYKKLIDKNLIKKTRKIIHSVGFSERSDTQIETINSEQWFLKTKELSKKTFKEEFDILFYPQRFEKIFKHWSNNLNDWCISRNIWWGHQIPAWTNKNTKEIFVSEDEPVDKKIWVKDEHVLDTWFSSTLWPFVALGWPNKESVLYKNFFPLDIQVSGYDIIYFWISRMIYQSFEFIDKKPFKKVLIHGLIRDKFGKKMSKSLNNGVNPMDEIKLYGSDSLRYFLLTSTSPGQDIYYNNNKVKETSYFINKIWNATKFTIKNLDYNYEIRDIKNIKLDLYDIWMLNKLYIVISNYEKYIEKYEFAEIGRNLYILTWEYFCNWYLEFTKYFLKNQKENTDKKIVFNFILDNILKLLHPFLPHVTEYLWKELGNKTILTISRFPEKEEIYNLIKNNKNEIKFVDLLQEIIIDIRRTKTKYKLSGKKILVNFNINNKIIEDNFKKNLQIIKTIEKLKDIYINNKNFPKNYQFIYSDLVMYINDVETENVINQEENLKIELEKIKKELVRSKKILNNENFLKKAPKSLVKEEREKFINYKNKFEKIEKQLLKLKE